MESGIMGTMRTELIARMVKTVLHVMAAAMGIHNDPVEREKRKKNIIQQSMDDALQQRQKGTSRITA